jgi:Flp pilus assembly pilin Flp
VGLAAGQLRGHRVDRAVETVTKARKGVVGGMQEGRAMTSGFLALMKSGGRNIRPMLKVVTTMVTDFLREESGQDLAEYALPFVFLSLAAIGVLPTLGKAVNNIYSRSASSLTTGS